MAGVVEHHADERELVERSAGDLGPTVSSDRPVDGSAATPGGSAQAEPAPVVRGGWWQGRRKQIWLLAGAVIFGAITSQVFGRPYNFFDMKIYHGAMEWWTGGNELYDFIAPNTVLGYTYPPFAALLMAPMAGTTAVVAGWINTVISVVALAGVLALVLFPVADRMNWPRWLTVAVALPLALAIEPSRETLGFGQVNLILFALVLADLVALRLRRDPRIAAGAKSAARRFWLSGAWAGAGIGLATAIKLTPGLFILYFIVAKQWKPAAVASITAAGATLAAWLVAPRESMIYFTSLVWQTDRVGNADFAPNQALSGLLARLYDQTEKPGMLWFSFAMLCLALGLSRAVAAHKEGDELAAFTLVGITAAIISPISWTHHLVFVVPAVVILGDAALRRRAAAQRLGVGSALAGLRYGGAALGVYALFLISPVWWVRHRIDEGGSHYDSGVWGVLAENSLILGLLLLLVLMPWRPGAEPAFPPHRADRLSVLRSMASLRRL